MKKIIFLIIIITLVLAIYILNEDNKVYYLALGDEITLNNDFSSDVTKYLKNKNIHENSITEFAKIGYRTTDLINDIKNNRKETVDNKKIYIRNAIIKADLITISIGMNDFIYYIDNNNLLSNNLINLKNDMDCLLKEIRFISKEKIILIGINKPKNIDSKIDQTLKKINNIYSELAQKYNIKYLDIYNDEETNIINKKLLIYIKDVII